MARNFGSDQTARAGAKEQPVHRSRIFEVVDKKCIALQTRLGAMRYKVSHLCIFSYDGTDRIRFAGQGYKA